VARCTESGDNSEFFEYFQTTEHKEQDQEMEQEEEIELNVYNGIVSDQIWDAIDQKLWTFKVTDFRQKNYYADYRVNSSQSECVKGFHLDFSSSYTTVGFPLKIYEIFPNLNAYLANGCTQNSRVWNNYFENLAELQLIDLSENDIDFIADDAFANLTNLQFLKLSDNRIDELYPSTFTFNLKLSQMYLENNYIKFLPKDIFEPLINLRNLSLAKNKLIYINRELFKHNEKLENLWLNDNQIEHLRSNTFDYFQHIRLVDLSENICINSTFERNEFFDLAQELETYC
jgi:Leucine-rich repeat (LRR) protein